MCHRAPCVHPLIIPSVLTNDDNPTDNKRVLLLGESTQPAGRIQAISKVLSTYGEDVFFLQHTTPVYLTSILSKPVSCAVRLTSPSATNHMYRCAWAIAGGLTESAHYANTLCARHRYVYGFILLYMHTGLPQTPERKSAISIKLTHFGHRLIEEKYTGFVCTIVQHYGHCVQLFITQIFTQRQSTRGIALLFVRGRSITTHNTAARRSVCRLHKSHKRTNSRTWWKYSPSPCQAKTAPRAHA